MGDQQPEQLQIHFARVDKPAPGFERTHHERQIRTSPEIVAETTRTALNAAGEIVSKARASKGVNVRFAIDLSKEEQNFNPKHAQTGPITRTQLETLAFALNSIPKSLYICRHYRNCHSRRSSLCKVSRTTSKRKKHRCT